MRPRFYDLASAFASQIFTASEESACVYEAIIGIVTDNKDPQKLGRVKLKFSTISETDVQDLLKDLSRWRTDRTELQKFEAFRATETGTNINEIVSSVLNIERFLEARSATDGRRNGDRRSTPTKRTLPRSRRT